MESGVYPVPYHSVLGLSGTCSFFSIYTSHKTPLHVDARPTCRFSFVGGAWNIAYRAYLYGPYAQELQNDLF